MKSPWIVLPMLPGLGTETPTSKPSMIRPLRTECEVSISNPVPPPVWLPSMMTLTRALLPSLACTLFGTDVIKSGSLIGLPPTITVWTCTVGLPPRQSRRVSDQVGKVFSGEGSSERHDVSPGTTGDDDVSCHLGNGGEGCLDLIRSGVVSDGAGRSRRQGRLRRQREEPPRGVPENGNLLLGRADLRGITEGNSHVSLSKPINRYGVGQGGQGSAERDGPILCRGIESGHRDVEKGVGCGRDVEGDVIGPRSGIGIQDGLPQRPGA